MMLGRPLDRRIGRREPELLIGDRDRNIRRSRRRRSIRRANLLSSSVPAVRSHHMAHSRPRDPVDRLEVHECPRIVRHDSSGPRYISRKLEYRRVRAANRGKLPLGGNRSALRWSLIVVRIRGRSSASVRTGRKTTSAFRERREDFRSLGDFGSLEVIFRPDRRRGTAFLIFGHGTVGSKGPSEKNGPRGRDAKKAGVRSRATLAPYPGRHVFRVDGGLALRAEEITGQAGPPTKASYRSVRTGPLPLVADLCVKNLQCSGISQTGTR